MRLRELKIDRYGPLREVTLSGIDGLTLVHGANEEGKTLLIDAIIRLLFRKRLGQRAKSFGNMTRVQESPEGYVVVEIDGQEIKIDRSDSLDKHITITPDDFRNIFVVRDSDLTILNEAEYLTDLTEKLTGLRTSEIHRIRKKLQLTGCLTNASSASELANNAESGHIRSKVETAEELAEEIHNLADALDGDDFERFEQTVAEKRETLHASRRELDLHRRAKLRAKCLEDQSNLDKLGAVRDELGRLAAFDQRDFEAWTHHERDLKRLREEVQDLRREQTEHDRHLTEIEETLAKNAAIVDEMLDRSRRIDDLIEPRIYEYQRLKNEYARWRDQQKLLVGGAVLASASFVASLVGAVIEPGFFFFVAGAACGVVAAALGVRLYLLRAAGSRLAAVFDALKTQASRLGFDVSSIDDLHRAKSNFDREYNEAVRLAEGARVNVGVHQKHAEESNRRMRDIRKEMDDIERSITEIKMRSGVMELAEYYDALRRKNEAVANERYYVAMLTQALGHGGDDAAEYWDRKVTRNLAETATQNPVEYDAKRETELIDRIEQMEVELATTEEALASGRQSLHDIETKVRNAEIPSFENIVCRTSGELRRLEEQLREFARATFERRDDARIALGILEEIENEEKSRVIELFGEDKTVSTYFKRITDGRYTQIRFEPEEGTMSVRTQDGEWITATALSGGALDQLYFAIRLSIAESIFGDSRGFFILDDPFVKSDMRRLENQIHLLRKLIAAGWQVLYFSAKKEVHDLFKADVAARRARLVSLDAVSAAVPARAARVPSPSNADLFLDGPTY